METQGTQQTLVKKELAGERHAQKVGKVQEEQVWAMWQIAGAPKYSTEVHEKEKGNCPS